MEACPFWTVGKQLMHVRGGEKIMFIIQMELV
jgi:hypothetical protein